jgi:hypothetical protein
MSGTHQPQPAGTGAANAAAAAELAQIQRRQERVIKAVLVPVWYWWVIAAGIVAIGIARDSGDLVVQAVTIPIFGLIVLVDGVIVGTAIGLAAARDPHPATIGCAAGAAVIVIAGPLVNRYLRRLMLTQARQQMSGAPQAAGTA